MKQSTIVLSIIVLGGLVFAGLVYFLIFIKNSAPGDQGETKIISGVVVDTSLDLSNFVIRDVSQNEVRLSITPATKLFDIEGKAVGVSAFFKGFEVAATGVQTSPNNFDAREIKITKEPNIIVDMPEPNDIVGESFTVNGRARVFENQFNIRVLSEGAPIYLAHVMADAPDVGLFGEFQYEVKLDPAKTRGITEVVLEVYENSARDGSEINKVTIPLLFESSDVRILKVFFGNDRMDPEQTCVKVFSVNRSVPRTSAVARAALNELLKGPTDEEKNKGFFTSINPGVVLQSVLIDASSTAYADFNDVLEQGVGGSCRVAAIRAQITETLKQFPGIKNVIISINGNSTTILQP